MLHDVPLRGRGGKERETCNIWQQTYFRLVNFNQPEVDGRIDLSHAWVINLRCLGGKATSGLSELFV